MVSGEKHEASAVDFYFIQEDGDLFKCTLIEPPYFLVSCEVLYLICLFYSRFEFKNNFRMY